MTYTLGFSVILLSNLSAISQEEEGSNRSGQGGFESQDTEAQAECRTYKGKPDLLQLQPCVTA